MSCIHSLLRKDSEFGDRARTALLSCMFEKLLLLLNELASRCKGSDPFRFWRWAREEKRAPDETEQPRHFPRASVLRESGSCNPWMMDGWAEVTPHSRVLELEPPVDKSPADGRAAEGTSHEELGTTALFFPAEKRRAP